MNYRRSKLITVTAFIDIVVLILAGVAAGNAVGGAPKEFNLGALKNTLVGGIGGAGSYFLQTFIPPTVDINGDPVLDYSIVNHVLILPLLSIIAGGILTMVLGFVMSEAFRSRSKSE